jgi:predicted nuclease of predicted toxin-antitoxin system
MPLRFLLDENISQVVADQVRRHRPTIVIESVHTWQDGAFEGRADKVLLLAARAEQLTLVTYDLKTIPDLLAEFHHQDQSHAGVIFVDDATIPNRNFGMLIRALLFEWDQFQAFDWTDSVKFIRQAV